MKRPCSLLLLLLLLARFAPAAEWKEDFNSDPSPRGWRVSGDASLFQWNPATGDLAVTWDSSKTNSFFYRPLGTVLAETDPFEVGFDVVFSEITAGGSDGAGGTFELAFGLYGTVAAFRTNFLRGAGVNAANGPRDVVEFTYFPDTVNGFGDTISPSIWSRSNQPNVDFIFPYPLLVGVPYRIEMKYDPATRALDTVLVSNAVPVLTNRVVLSAASTGFRLDAIGVASYRSTAGDSILAHARMDNFTVVVPDPPLLDLAWTPDGPELGFLLPMNWTAAIERTVDLSSWERVGETNAVSPGDGTFRHVVDAASPATNAVYRLKLSRP
jgi:hypothetical protein